jgi:hypothetical protein
MSDEIRANISAMAKALCYYPLGPSNVNSCCPGIGRCEMDAAIAEITRLRAELATARREGMEEAAQIAENHSDLKGAELLKRFSQVTVARGTNIFTKREIAAAIRAAAKEVQP